LEAKARALANLEAPTAEYVLGAYHHLWQIEKSFRMSALAVSHWLERQTGWSIKKLVKTPTAHLAVVFIALAVSHWIEGRTGWTIKKFIRSPRPYRTVNISTGSHLLTAEDPYPTTSAKRWPLSTPRVRTSLAQLRPCRREATADGRWWMDFMVVDCLCGPSRVWPRPRRCRCASRCAGFAGRLGRSGRGTPPR
jgi:hypothetical protein